MLFNSLDFAAFFLVVYGLYLILPQRGQNVLLLAASYTFYCFWDWRFLGLIITSTVVDYVVARLIAGTEDERKRRAFLLISLITNLSILGFFKYFNFFLESADSLMSLCGWGEMGWELKVLLPIGISFYTFKTMSYTLDVHGRQMQPTRNLVDYAAFVAFFPQLLSGPIDRASTLLPQIEQRRRVTRDDLASACWLIFWGLFKKAVVADNLAGIVDQGFSGQMAPSTIYAWVAIYAFAVQLYCDFSGYTDIARGLAKAMGFETTINFRNPFFATTPVEFWQRWHISLSQWIQDYIYFPMAASMMRKHAASWSQPLAILLTMTLIGLWHGAKMTAVLMGVYWGLLIVAYNMYRSWRRGRARRERQPPAAGAPAPFTPRRLFFMVIYFHLTCLGFVLFRADTLAEAAMYFRSLFSMSGSPESVAGSALVTLNAIAALVVLWVPVIAIQVLQERTGDLLLPMRLSLLSRAALYAVLLLSLVLLGNTGGQAFIYIQF